MCCTTSSKVLVLQWCSTAFYVYQARKNRQLLFIQAFFSAKKCVHISSQTLLYCQQQLHPFATMSSDLRTEDILLQVREKLNKDQIKLWLSPYYTEENGPSESELESLSKTFSSSLNIDVSNCLIALKSLQARSLERLREREQFKDTGVATLKIRIPSHQSRSNQLTVQIKLTDLGRDLQIAVSEQISEIPERVKLISKGRVLNSQTSLLSQQITHGTQIMAVILQQEADNEVAASSNQNVLETTLAAAKLLASRSDENFDDDDDYYSLQIADQSGKKLQLPREEKRALVFAMSLHEKGRVALKAENYALALLLFLEADKEFSICNSRILQSVDNYALLNLDIAWCYLCLRSVNHLPDAEERLRICEQSFHRSYGPNLERVMVLKGTTGNEAALYMRLHLLQAIVLFHKNKRQEAAKLLSLVETELGNLKVDDNSICTLMEMGYTPEEARLSLRATHGDINAAAEHINRRRKEREELMKKEAAERKLNKERRLLGRCADGTQWVEPQLHKLLLSMGFDVQLARRALQHTNNSVQMSVQLMQEQPHLLHSNRVNKKSVDQVVALGFDRPLARKALSMHHGNVEQAVEELLHGSVSTVQASPEVAEEESEEGNKEFVDEGFEMVEEAFSQLTEGMATHEEDHLDLVLVHEEAFLREYKSLLNS